MKFVEVTLHQHCTSVHFSIQHPRTLGRPSRAGVWVGGITQPTRMPARDGRPRVRGRLVKSNYFIVRPKVDQRPGLLSLPQLGIFAIHMR